jgi:hypothetical protein
MPHYYPHVMTEVTKLELYFETRESASFSPGFFLKHAILRLQNCLLIVTDLQINIHVKQEKLPKVPFPCLGFP